MVQLEERVKAIHELMIDERRARQVYEATLDKHQQADDARFASIDSRMQGFQTQISAATDTLNRIEKSLVGENGIANRLAAVEGEWTARTAVQRFLSSAWTHTLAGAGVGIAFAELLHALGAF
jgi:hypothetical protein